jgi:hypothetical protein
MAEDCLSHPFFVRVPQAMLLQIVYPDDNIVQSLRLTRRMDFNPYGGSNVIPHFSYVKHLIKTHFVLDKNDSADIFCSR